MSKYFEMFEIFSLRDRFMKEKFRLIPIFLIPQKLFREYFPSQLECMPKSTITITSYYED